MDSIFLSEAVGTGLLVLFGDSVVAGVLLSRTKSENAGWLVVTTGWALAIMVGVFAATTSFGHINPAVTIGLAVAGDLDWGSVPEYVGGQFLGAFVGAVLMWLVYLPHWAATEDPARKLGAFSNSPAIRNTGANLLTEAIATFTLVLGVYAILTVGGSDPRPDLSTGLTPVLVGFLVWGIAIGMGGPTGFALNPARDLGPRIAHAVLPIPRKGSSDWGYGWIPVVGPLVGGIAGALLGHALFGAL